MKTKQAQKDITLIQLFDRFATDAKARKHLESVLWKNGVICPKCKCNDQAKFSDIKPNAAAKTRAGLRWCANCKDKFTVTIGTVFEDSKIQLRKWLIAWYMICSSKKGISSLQLQRILELGSYRTALFMAHRIRHALRDTSFAEKLDGTIEADECFVPVGTQPESEGKCPTKHAMVFIQQVLLQTAIINQPPVEYEVKSALVESARGASAFISTGKIFARRESDLKISVNGVSLFQGWKKQELPKVD